ncbi:hypothetical protein RIF29_35153 [Crotalaria pallida]|uniref:Uncharacterized protein n=1 Tax=Crotalaria pallida TaxID=3830 RepID=A0AAN9EAU4_CROPI
MASLMVVYGYPSRANLANLSKVVADRLRLGICCDSVEDEILQIRAVRVCRVHFGAGFRMHFFLEKVVDGVHQVVDVKSPKDMAKLAKMDKRGANIVSKMDCDQAGKPGFCLAR